MKTELRTAVSSFAIALGTSLDYVLCNRRDGSEVTLRQLVDRLAEPEGASVTDIVNTLGVSANPITPHVVEIAKQLGVKFAGRGRGPSGDPVKAMLGKLDASKLIAMRIAALGKVKPTETTSEVVGTMRLPE